MKISIEDVDYLAKLSNFDLTEQEKTTLKTDLENILNYVKELDQVDTEGVDPTYQVLDLKNVWREDELVEEPVGPDQLIEMSPASAERHIKVAKVL